MPKKGNRNNNRSHTYNKSGGGNNHGGNNKRGGAPKLALPIIIAAVILCAVIFAFIKFNGAGYFSGSDSGNETTQYEAADGETGGAADNAQTAESAGNSDETDYVSLALSEVGEWSGMAYAELNGGVPYFSDAKIEEAESGGTYISLSELDYLGRCGVCEMVGDASSLPDTERGDISSVYPAGWNQKFYDIVDQEALYNRCHLLMRALSGLDAEERNLITGTRYMNADGMLKGAEEEILEYASAFDGAYLYRVTPVFYDEELIARGVIMEAMSLEDGGEELSVCIYCYNVQPGIEIDYSDGSSNLSDDWEDECENALYYGATGVYLGNE